MKIDEIVSRFKAAGINLIKDDDYCAFYFEIYQLCVKIFSNDYPNTNYRGKILAEHSVNFDKWSKAFYKSDFPKSINDFDILLTDLKHISSDDNKISGNVFGSLTRKF